MGNILKPTCPCGTTFEKIHFGGVKSNFRTVCDVPAIEKASGAFTVVNYYDYEIRKVKLPFYKRWFKKDALPSEIPYTFYNDKKVQGSGSDNGHTIQNFNFVMYEKNNFCPNCKAFSLDFKIIAYTD